MINASYLSLNSASGLSLLQSAAQGGSPGAQNSTAGSGANALTSETQKKPAPTSASSPLPPAPAAIAANATFVFSVSQSTVSELVVDHQQGQSVATLMHTPSTADFEESYISTAMQNYSLTSQQISAALYSGKGLVDPGTTDSASFPPEYDTFRQQINAMTANANELNKIVAQRTDWLAQGRPVQNSDGIDAAGLQGDTDDQIEGMNAFLQKEANQEAQLVNELTRAFNRGDLSFEKTTDVPGLNFVGTQTWNVDGGWSSGSAKWSYNEALMAPSDNGEQHTLMNIGDVVLYLSWDD